MIHLRIIPLVLMLLLSAAPFARAQDGWEDAAELMKETVQRIIVPKSALTDSPQVRSAFREVVQDPSRWTCRVLAGSREVALGTIVDSSGWIVTKASQIASRDGQPTETIFCRLAGGKKHEAKLVGIDHDSDLALLKIEAQGLPVVEWGEASLTHVGQWAVTPGLSSEPLAVGVVSVLPREIPKPTGILGIVLEEHDAGALIIQVLPDSGAARAGLQVGDVVTYVNGERTTSRETLINFVRQFSPGDEIRVTIRREGEELERKATLSEPPRGRSLNRRDVQNNMGSELSARRAGFPQALQHDTVLRPADCGGPLVNLDGQALGVNIARAGRTESFAIAANEVQKIVAELRSKAE